MPLRMSIKRKMGSLQFVSAREKQTLASLATF